MTANLLERLENRNLLSIAFVNGVLRVDGTSGADVITVKTSGLTGVRVSDNGIVQRFSGVGTVVIFGSAGNDILEIAADKLAAVGFEIQTTTPDEFAQLMQREMARMAKLVRDAGIKAEP